MNDTTINENASTEETKVETNATITETNKTESAIENKETAPIIPEGFDEDIYDVNTMSLKPDAVKERLAELSSKIEKAEKSAKDMRRKLSKGVETPDNIEGYKEGYVAPEAFDAFIEDKESELGKFLNSNLDNLNKISYEAGLTTQQANIIKDNFLQLMQDVHIIQQPEEIEKSKAKIEKDMKESLGDNFKDVMVENGEFVANYGIFDEAERKMLSTGIKNNPVVNTLLTKIRTLFDKSGTKIPVKTNVVNGLADDVALWSEYSNPNTSDNRKMEIIQQRIAAGRTNNFGSV
ncbi:MAG: hypothetical protein GX638_17725 [Crenarchaeota archaeon]|nr:hypothetical protein [Thermoproteota archaeon]